MPARSSSQPAATIEDLSELKKEAAACAPGDTCVFAGGLDCACATPVTAKRAAEVEERAQSVSCFGEGVVECPHGPGAAAECVEGHCRAAAAQ
ncbi:MAG: hypothetical protein ACOX6T_11375 [Myxococcales bacterium]